ncbi:hypothetical protein GCM10007103_00490 [Salinimicrobium marinum]|uniref:Uncharacterized protein n=1 Tax=Salinimicrobium marinum TaxID=680283 RepID=A0A918VRT8_9FLAO|nr:hypothetical protein [Salinimicrobium marinum]GHA23353.1 hypothetical protein GCM10007103_00490 [Salinimicrobium marinum]
MKPATIKQLKDELKHRSHQELLETCLRLSKFKKENKELLTYLLFESTDESAYIERVKKEVEAEFDEINTNNYYYIKKSIRKILRNLKKYIRYSGKKETEVELLIYFLLKMDTFSPSVHRDKTLQGLYDRQRAMVEKKIASLHEDLQYDFEVELEELSR